MGPDSKPHDLYSFAPPTIVKFRLPPFGTLEHAGHLKGLVPETSSGALGQLWDQPAAQADVTEAPDTSVIAGNAKTALQDPDAKKEADGQSPSASTNTARSSDEETFIWAQQFVRDHGIVVLFNRLCIYGNGPVTATRPEDIGPVLRRQEIDERWILSEFIMTLKAAGMRVRNGDAQRAVKKVMREAIADRHRVIFERLIASLSEAEQAATQADWARLATIFDMDRSLTVAILAHFIWQVKRKALGLPVVHHLMPIAVSPVQGSGKTTFAAAFLRPLEELVAGPALLTDIADARSGDIFRYPAILIDDIGKVPGGIVATLKSVITAQALNRRILGTSMSAAIKMRSTLFGTANNAMEELIPDHTGHRRFVSMQFRNGAVEKGGDRDVWEIVANTNYERLWRSIDAFAPSPIEVELDALFAHQAANVPAGPLLNWLRAIDTGSEDFLRIRKRDGVQARDLYDKYVRDTGSTISETRFGTEIKRLFRDPNVPFADFARTRHGVFYSLKPIARNLVDQVAS